MTKPAVNESPSSNTIARTFARADHRWKDLSASPDYWQEPDKRRDLAVAFLNYHAAKLALAEGSCVRHG